MSSEPVDPSGTLGDLLEHQPFVRSLARKLLSDEHDAEDVVQDTWLAALARHGEPQQMARSWLGRVTRNVAADRRRRRQRRIARERDAAQSEALPSASQDFEREAIRKTLASALLALEEPYRSALILRFYQDLPPREVARRQRVPVETARTRIKRGLALLRTRMREHGRDWCVALAMLAELDPATLAPRHSPRAAARRFRTPSRAQLSVAVGLVVAFLGTAWLAGTVGERNRGPLAPTTSGDSSGGVDSPLAAADSAPARVSTGRADARSTDGSSRSDDTSTPAQGSAEVTGRTLDPAGNAVPNAEVNVWTRWPPEDEPAQRTTSDAMGRYVLPGLPRSFFILARKPPLAPVEIVVGDLAPNEKRGEVDLVLDTPLTLRGRVVDAQGAGVQGAWVRISIPEGEGGTRPSRSRGLFLSPLVEKSTTSAADGSFAFATPPGIYSVTAVEPSLGSRQVLARAGGGPVEVNLWPGVAARVQVTDADGTPLEGARVSFKFNTVVRPPAAPLDWEGSFEASTGLQGLCEAPLRLPAKAWFFARADAAGWGSAIIGPLQIGESGSPHVLRLARSRSAHGRVLTGAGEPVARARVRADLPLERSRAIELHFEATPDLHFLARTTTDADGRFGFEELPSEPLLLSVQPVEPGHLGRRSLLEAGRDETEIVLADRDSALSIIEGRVSDGISGLPLERFTVTFLPGGDASSAGWTRQTFVASAGEFTIPVLDEGRGNALFQSDGFATAMHAWSALDPGVERLDIELLAVRDLALRVVDESGLPVRGAWLRIADSQGVPLVVRSGPRLEESALRCGADGTAYLYDLPATVVEIGVGAHPRGEFRAFEFDLRRPLTGVQEVRIAAYDLEHPPARFDLALGIEDEEHAARWSWQARSSELPRVSGRALVRLSDDAGRAVWTLSGEFFEGRFRIDPDAFWASVLYDSEGTPVHVWVTLPRCWDFDLAAERRGNLVSLQDLPCPAGAFRLEIVRENEAPISLDVSAPPDAGSRTLVVRLPRARR